MSREKQIEEMAKDFCALSMPCEECHLYKNRCHAKKYATRASNAGYRKASEVALRVIGEIEEATNNHIKAISRLEPQNDYCAGGKKALEMTLKVLAELKKKYESEKDNG